MRRLITGACALGLALSIVFFVDVAPAHAATRAEKAVDICNQTTNNYKIIDRAYVKVGSTNYGELFLLYNGGNNCAVLIKIKNYGTASYTMVTLANEANSVAQDGSDNYKYYAGPVKVYGKGYCVYAAGRMAGGARGEIPWGHCGS